MSDFLPIGYIAKSHGLKGGLTLSLAGIDASMLKTVFIELNREKVPYKISSLTGNGSKCYALLEGVTTVEEALLLKGSKIFLHKNDVAVPEAILFENEIANFSAIDKLRGNIGLVNGLQHFGGIAYLAVTTPLQKEVLIPSNSPFIKSIKKREKKIHVELPDNYPGL